MFTSPNKYPVIAMLFWKRHFIPSLRSLCTFFLENHLASYVWIYFWTLSLPFIYLSIFFCNTTFSWLLYIYSKSWNQNIEVLKFFSFFLNIALAILVYLHIHKNFRISLSTSANTLWDFGWDWIEIINLEKRDFLTIQT